VFECDESTTALHSNMDFGLKSELHGSSSVRDPKLSILGTTATVTVTVI